MPESDEFRSSATLSRWLRIHETENWHADQLEALDLNTTEAGSLFIRPRTVVWYADWRGPMLYKAVDGDFALTTRVRVADRNPDLDSIPNSLYSLAGLMLRGPTGITNPATQWMGGHENYIFLSLGHGDNGGTAFQFEVKTTIGAVSTLQLSLADSDTAELQLARVHGVYFFALYRLPGEDWVLHRRFHRPDLAGQIQAGMVCYTDWAKANNFSRFFHNGNALGPGLVVDPTPWQPFAPDLDAYLSYARFHRPVTPAALAGVDLMDTNLVPDAHLLAFLGAAVNVEALAEDLDGDGCERSRPARDLPGEPGGLYRGWGL